MNEINPETNILPDDDDFQRQVDEKRQIQKANFNRKKTIFANKELEKLDQDFTKLKIRMDIKEPSAQKLQSFLATPAYQKIIAGLETHRKLEITLVQKRQQLIELHKKNQNLDDMKEFFEFLKDENQFGSRRDKIQTFEVQEKEDVFIAHQIYGKQSKMEVLLEEQTKNVTFINSMIRNTGLFGETQQIESTYKKFDLEPFRDRLAEIRNDCEKYIDPFDLRQALNNKKSIRTLIDELNIDYDFHSKQVKKTISKKIDNVVTRNYRYESVQSINDNDL